MHCLPFDEVSVRPAVTIAARSRICAALSVTVGLAAAAIVIAFIFAAAALTHAAAPPQHVPCSSWDARAAPRGGGKRPRRETTPLVCQRPLRALRAPSARRTGARVRCDGLEVRPEGVADLDVGLLRWYGVKESKMSASQLERICIFLKI